MTKITQGGQISIQVIGYSSAGILMTLYFTTVGIRQMYKLTTMETKWHPVAHQQK